MSRACRLCGSALTTTMVDLGTHPLCESFLTPAQLDEMEPHYPLHVRVCGNCFLAQIDEFVAPEVIFDEYAYFSSYSSSWLDHAKAYVEMMIERFRLQPDGNVLEIASNDGYLLQYFLEYGYQVLGVEPSWNVAAAAEEKGIKTLKEFFNESFAKSLAKDGYRADVVLGNNVLAHTPDINGFAAGVPVVLSETGVATFEFPHLMRLMEQNQFDTIYHEHWSYLSLGTTQRLFAEHGMVVFDVEELPTHGGSLRLFVRHEADRGKPVSDNVHRVLEAENDFGLFDLDTYRRFSADVRKLKRQLLALLIEAKEQNKTVAIYGAAGKGNTLLNYCGIGTDFVDFAADMNPFKHGRYTPGSHIPIYPPEHIAEMKPDLVLILPWNIKSEIMEQLSFIADWGGSFLVPIPEPAIHKAVAS